MTLPETYTLIRHGYSEANVVQTGRKANTLTSVPEDFFLRHDSKMRLTPLGVEQAKSAGEWIKKNELTFDRFYSSPHVRAVETASHLQLGGQWILDDRFRERDYGEVQSIGEDMADPNTKASLHNKELSKWYWKPQAGESLATGVRLRVESVMNTFHRREGIKNTVAVSHGEFIRTSQFVIERLTPDLWNLQNVGEEYKVQNCMIIQYSRVNPEDPSDITRNFKWKRGICPWDETLSWDGGEWTKIGIVKYSDDDLKKYVENHARIF